jgi:hypothetical protein
MVLNVFFSSAVSFKGHHGVSQSCISVILWHQWHVLLECPENWSFWTWTSCRIIAVNLKPGWDINRGKMSERLD